MIINSKKFYIVGLFFFAVAIIMYVIDSNNKYKRISQSDSGKLYTVADLCEDFQYAYMKDADKLEVTNNICAKYMSKKNSAYYGDLKKICKDMQPIFSGTYLDFGEVDDSRIIMIFRCDIIIAK